MAMCTHVSTSPTFSLGITCELSLNPIVHPVDVLFLVASPLNVLWEYSLFMWHTRKALNQYKRFRCIFPNSRVEGTQSLEAALSVEVQQNDYTKPFEENVLSNAPVHG